MSVMMARPMYASVLPTITCADCGRDIDISMMGEHVCVPQPGGVSTHISPSNHDRIAPLPLLAPKTFERPPSRTSKTPSITASQHESIVSERPRSPGATAGLHRASTLNVPLVTPGNAPQAVSSLQRPPQPVRSFTDPVDDTRQIQHSASPRVPSQRKGAPAHLTLAPRPSDPASAPMSPMSPSFRGANVLKRMDTMTRGPFGSRARKEPPKIQLRPNVNEGQTRPQGTEQVAMVSGVGEIMNQIPATKPPRPPRPDTDDSLLEKLQEASIEGEGMTSFLDRPGVTVSPPSSSGDGAVDVKAGARELESRDESQQMTVHARGEEEIKPLPDLTTLHSRPQRQPNHTSVSSESSTSSRSGFESRTESSRSSHSSPFTLSSPGEFHRKTMSIDQESVHSSTRSNNRASTTHHKLSDSDTREAAFGEPSPLALHSPSIGQPNITPLRTSNAPMADLSSPLSPTSPRSPAREKQQELRRRPASRSKGQCRGCNKDILGKSIKAADGRLTGRYHRECFVCHTCKTSFDTAEFYVLNNNPYCAHHYHVLNHSLCHSCNRGIEGEYLETGPRRRYHTDCFTCHDCKRSLTSDYYELNSRFYCESDALSAYENSRLLSPGKRFPERRMTRMMQM